MAASENTNTIITNQQVFGEEVTPPSEPLVDVSPFIPSEYLKKPDSGSSIKPNQVRYEFSNECTCISDSDGTTYLTFDHCNPCYYEPQCSEGGTGITFCSCEPIYNSTSNYCYCPESAEEDESQIDNHCIHPYAPVCNSYGPSDEYDCVPGSGDITGGGIVNVIDIISLINYIMGNHLN